MRLLNLFKKKINVHQKKLIEDFGKGKILQIDNGINNKQYLNGKKRNGTNDIKKQ